MENHFQVMQTKIYTFYVTLEDTLWNLKYVLYSYIRELHTSNCVTREIALSWVAYRTLISPLWRWLIYLGYTIPPQTNTQNSACDMTTLSLKQIIYNNKINSPWTQLLAIYFMLRDCNSKPIGPATSQQVDSLSIC